MDRVGSHTLRNLDCHLGVVLRNPLVDRRWARPERRVSVIEQVEEFCKIVVHDSCLP